MDEKVKRLCRGLAELGPFVDVPSMAEAVGRRAGEQGWSVEEHAEVFFEGSQGRRRGLLDFVLRAGAEVVAVELDRRTPRGKSLAKLAAYAGATERLVILRESPARPHRVGEVVVFATKPTRAVERAMQRTAASRRT